MVRGQKNTITSVPQVKQDVRASIHNRFDVEVVDAVTGEVKQKAYAENIVLNALWTRMLAPNTYFNHIHYGTGSGTLAATRTSLFTFLGAKAAGEKTIACDMTNGWVSSRKKIQIAPEEHVGSEFKEVGIGWSATAANLVTHALLKDMNGNTITIVKTATDVINIYATVFVHWDVAGYAGARFLVYPSMIQNNQILTMLLGDYAAFTVLYAAHSGHERQLYDSSGVGFTTEGNYLQAQNLISLVFTPAAKTISVASYRFAVDKANIGGIRTIVLSAPYNAGYSFVPQIAFTVEEGGFYEKTSITAEALGSGDGVTTAFNTDFAFVLPGSKVYVDGIEQTAGVTVLTGLPAVKTDMGRYFKLVDSYGGVYPWPQTVPDMRPIMGSWAIYENPYREYGIASYSVDLTTVEVSNDLSTWVMVSNTSGTIVVPESLRQYRYWRFTGQASSRANFFKQFTADTLPENDVVFATPPAAGAVITIDYDTESVAKDTNHVFDFSLTITLGEKTD